jgi:hypothetical protein
MFSTHCTKDIIADRLSWGKVGGANTAWPRHELGFIHHPQAAFVEGAEDVSANADSPISDWQIKGATARTDFTHRRLRNLSVEPI